MRLAQYLQISRALKFWADRGEGTSEFGPEDAELVWRWTRPYVCVIHDSTGKGYYLDRSYNYICTVENMPRPGVQNHELPNEITRVVPHETELHHQAASFTTPDWAEGLNNDAFTTYWLY